MIRTFFLVLIFGIFVSCLESDDQYTLVIEGFDWGPAVNKVILPMERKLTSVEGLRFTVEVTRQAECAELRPEDAKGKRQITAVYVSDSRGNPVSQGTHVTLDLEVSPELVLSNPFYYSTDNGCSGNNWVTYRLQIFEEMENQSWIEEKKRILPLVEKFKLDHSYAFSPDLKLNYAYYAPSESEAKTPLIIWLHGGGEGGRDTSIPLLANRAANYASKEIQHFFGSAYVLVPQCPGAWMHNEDGEVTWGKDNDAYNEALMALIADFVKENSNIDSNRIYVGGCSNGGYMSLKLMLLHPDYFAAGFISALAYRSEYLSEQELNRIKHMPIWFIHAKDDRTTPPEETVVPVYNRLIELGADKLQFSFYDHVYDVSGEFGGTDYHYSGHWSWIYSHANKARINSNGQAVESLPGQPSLMEWLADQTREKR